MALKLGDACTVNERADQVLSGRYRSLIGKRVMVMGEEKVNGKYPIQVLNPSPTCPWEFSSQLQMREDLLTKEN